MASLRILVSAAVAALTACNGRAGLSSIGIVPSQRIASEAVSNAHSSGCRHVACIYVTDYDSPFHPHDRVIVFAGDANGNATPVTRLRGRRTRMDAPNGIFVDAGRRIYIANPYFGHDSVTVYAAGAAGHPKPIQEIRGSNTGLDFPLGVAADSARNIYVINIGTRQPSITMYASGAHGNVAPIRTIAGSNTKLIESRSIALDDHNNIYVANSAYGQFPGSITVYNAGANGNVSPIQEITGSNTGIYGSSGVAVDSDRNIYVASLSGNAKLETAMSDSFSSGSVTVYAAGATGNVAPVRKISGPNTALEVPFGVALDSDRNIYVANYIGGITAYPAGANGNVAPFKDLTGPNTLLRSPASVAVR